MQPRAAPWVKEGKGKSGSPEGASQSDMFVAPFQGLGRGRPLSTQGVALGYGVLSPSGSNDGAALVA